MKEIGRRKKRLCCSKKILVASFSFAAVLTIATVAGTFLTDKDMNAITTVAGLAWGETATAAAFYYWKARAENKIKLTHAMVDDWAEKYGIEAVIQLAGITLSD